MKLLKLERIGDGGSYKFAQKTPYCKRVVGIGSRGLVAENIPAKRDYSNANGAGTRGVYDYYLLKEGCIYEIMEPITWKRTEHYYLLVRDGKDIRMTFEEVFECLRSGLVPMS